MLTVWLLEHAEVPVRAPQLPHHRSEAWAFRGLYGTRKTALAVMERCGVPRDAWEDTHLYGWLAQPPVPTGCSHFYVYRMRPIPVYGTADHNK